MEYGVSEYTLVFRRVRTRKNGRAGRFWVVARPCHCHVGVRSPVGSARQRAYVNPMGVSHPVFFVPICSTLGLDKSSYEAFLLSVASWMTPFSCFRVCCSIIPNSVETTRKRIQSLIMAAEVQPSLTACRLDSKRVGATAWTFYRHRWNY